MKRKGEYPGWFAVMVFLPPFIAWRMLTGDTGAGRGGDTRGLHLLGGLLTAWAMTRTAWVTERGRTAAPGQSKSGG